MTKATAKFDMHGLDMATKHMSVQESEAATIGEKRALACPWYQRSKSHRGSLAISELTGENMQGGHTAVVTKHSL